ncbi:MAG TPA: hypothetical protein VIL46_18320 [Gemmataceae bacterium]
MQPARSYAPLKCGSPERDSEGWLCVKDLNKTEAEQLLDWLEANGLCRRTVSFQADGKFLVRWRPAETK